MIPSLRSERGLSLTELVIVGVLATLVMIGLVGFYINSQATWTDGSTQAQAQRDATLLLEVMADSVRSASTAVVDSAGSTFSTLHLYAYGDPVNEVCRFWWNPDDSKVHLWSRFDGPHGPVIDSQVDQFQLSPIDNSLIELTLLKVRTADGQVVQTGSRFALYNRE